MKICKACDTEYKEELSSCPMCGSNKYYSESELTAEAERQKKEIETYKNSVGQGSKTKYRVRQATAILIVLILVSSVGYFVAKKVQYNREIKYCYETGRGYYEMHDYEDAIGWLSEVPSNSKYYKSSQEMLNDACNQYIAEIEQKVDRYLNEEDYEAAMEAIDHAKNVVPNASLIEPISKGVEEKYKADVLSKALKYADEKKYPDAITLLEKASGYLSPDMDIDTMLTSYRDTYRERVIKSAKKKLDKEGYEKGMDTLLAAKDVLKDDEKLDSAIKEFRSYQPVYLYEMDPYEVNSYTRIGNGGFALDTDNYGNQYETKGVISHKDVAFHSEVGVVRYNINKEYNVLEGTIYVPYESRNINSSYWSFSSIEPTSIMVYGDGKKLYSAKRIYETDKPYRFTVDISGVEFLEIRVDGGWYKGDASGQIPSMCVANLAVSKR